MQKLAFFWKAMRTQMGVQQISLARLEPHDDMWTPAASVGMVIAYMIHATSVRRIDIRAGRDVEVDAKVDIFLIFIEIVPLPKTVAFFEPATVRSRDVVTPVQPIDERLGFGWLQIGAFGASERVVHPALLVGPRTKIYAPPVAERDI